MKTSSAIRLGRTARSTLNAILNAIHFHQSCGEPLESRFASASYFDQSVTLDATPSIAKATDQPGGHTMPVTFIRLLIVLLFSLFQALYGGSLHLSIATKNQGATPR